MTERGDQLRDSFSRSLSALFLLSMVRQDTPKGPRCRLWGDLATPAAMLALTRRKMELSLICSMDEDGDVKFISIERKFL